ncbi:RNA polymerase II mediator complex subunit [Pseudogymnoascus destructans]|uniref:Mediator of RNA polymerase II transcription subunit 12 n=2 Tax=Pseudogymnoascus destructans TaxID=655981 RepID=L8FRN1_PSED2|nr:RNA polymerase II mediator complex subunit [Pseudogymnoascus destructans]ELR03214.1 hypothetical protein GMDG_01197 [Pseudogymnoascus destructans 20631-21]OAF61201.1 RNA polymerase II mediator complex subunit [Pseudogymnoascus destructans]
MSTRPPQPGPRPPQHSLGGTGMLQRQAQQRSHLQQSQQPSRGRTSDSVVEVIADGAETAPPRLEPSKPGGSMVRVEGLTAQKQNIVSMELPSQAGTPGAVMPLPKRAGQRIPFRRHDAQSDAPKQVGSPHKSSANLPLPMPARPGRSGVSHIRRQAHDAGNSPKKESRPKPYVLEAPLDAPSYTSNGHLDYFPWTGTRDEDTFNDNVIRQGYFDKIQTGQNETASAKQQLYPSLRLKNGLQTLGSLFAHVLGQRRQHSQITAAPSFKPPPRVTLTDTKRETWLRDLANPLIPLRRLSRTIPHGIKNKVLLEQCTRKNVPTERAVWLAKCVGANEIRASKRKGVPGALAMGGESKWIRDWTVCVEQFVDGVVTAGGDKDWKSKVLYSIRLSAHLYSEQLLDTEHYLDWLLSSLESTPLTRLPIWLLIAEVYWADILRYRKSARRLVAALCSNLQDAHESPDRDLLLPLIERVGNIVTATVQTNPESFIALSHWPKYSDTLVACNTSGGPDETQIFDAISRRNARLKSRSSGGDETQNSRRLVIDLLDASLSVQFSQDLPRECWKGMRDRILLVQTLFDWATSCARPSLMKTFVAARLMRTWSRHGVDVDESVLNYLTFRSNGHGVSSDAVYHLVSELARSGHFSVSKYIQWVIARGGLHGSQDVAADGPCVTRLLAELPVHDLPENLLKIRKTLLNRASFSVNDETETIDNMSLAFERCSPNLYGKTPSGEEAPTAADVVQNITHLSRTVKAELGLRLRKQINLRMTKASPSETGEWKAGPEYETATTVTVADFNLTRAVLEATEDLSILADILKLVSSSSSTQILASIADTLNMHRLTFSAIGALNDLFDTLVLRQCSLGVIQGPESVTLLHSLCALSATIPDVANIHVQLSRDVARSVRRSAADACSPVSDHVAEALQKSDGDISDEVDKLLSSGTSMDAPTLKRLFQVIINQMEASWAKSDPGLQKHGPILERLRTFDTKQFDTLLTPWVEQMILKSDRPNLGHVLGPLISAGCLSFKEHLKVSASSVQKTRDGGDKPTTSRIAFESLSLVLNTYRNGDIMSVEDAYTLNIRQTQAQLKDHLAILKIARIAIEISEPSADNNDVTINLLCLGDAFRRFLRRLVLTEFDCVLKEFVTPLAKSQDLHIISCLRAILCGLLDLKTTTGTEDLVVARQIEVIFGVASDLTLPFCQLALRSLSASEIPGSSSESAADTSRLEAYERAVDTALANNNPTWTKIIPTLDAQIAQHLCDQAERSLLATIPSFKPPSFDSPAPTKPPSDPALAKRMLFVISATAYSTQNLGHNTTALDIGEKINNLAHALSQPQSMQTYSQTTTWLPLMLEYITTHASTLPTSRPATDVRARVLLALSALLLALHAHTGTDALSEHVLDVSLLLVDELPDDARAQCGRFLAERGKEVVLGDPGLRYVFGLESGGGQGEAGGGGTLMISQRGRMEGFVVRRWECLSEPTPLVGENDAALSLSLFQARR